MSRSGLPTSTARRAAVFTSSRACSLSNWVMSTRWLFCASAVGFTLTSLLCGWAWNIESMILFRALQGFLGGSMGMAVGEGLVAAARLAATVLRSLVWGVSTTDMTTFAAAVATVLAVALVAVFVPALRIVRLNPIRALRQR